MDETSGVRRFSMLATFLETPLVCPSVLVAAGIFLLLGFT